MAPKAASRFRNAFIDNVHRHMQRADELGRLTTDVGQLSVWLEIISDRIVAIETQWSDLDRLRLAGSPIIGLINREMPEGRNSPAEMAALYTSFLAKAMKDDSYPEERRLRDVHALIFSFARHFPADYNDRDAARRTLLAEHLTVMQERGETRVQGFGMNKLYAKATWHIIKSVLDDDEVPNVLKSIHISMIMQRSNLMSFGQSVAVTGFDYGGSGTYAATGTFVVTMDCITSLADPREKMVMLASMLVAFNQNLGITWPSAQQIISSTDGDFSMRCLHEQYQRLHARIVSEETDDAATNLPNDDDVLSSAQGSSGIAEEMTGVDLRAMLDANLAEDMTYINQLTATITSEIRMFDDAAAGQSQ